jgi:hypothetical protein
MTLPAVSDTACRNLYKITEAIKRDAPLEAIKYVSETLALAYNENRWCMGSDKTLLQLIKFFEKLRDALPVTAKKDILDILENTLRLQSGFSDAKYGAPEKPDQLEREYLCQALEKQST